ncbi:hypothetical protein MTR_4g079745 [Medicago truncatula]|uniref:Uncharacterized protein n=1 Tax=Medicago truncatula TaxID=3880 RepID=A0A072UMW7_MEDTR|nr:hypothetical protein MTR_4g079745 [Medicago truncatula]
MLTLLTNLFGFLQTEDIAHPLGLRVALEKQAKSNSFYVTQRSEDLIFTSSLTYFCCGQH